MQDVIVYVFDLLNKVIISLLRILLKCNLLEKIVAP